MNIDKLDHQRLVDLALGRTTGSLVVLVKADIPRVKLDVTSAIQLGRPNRSVTIGKLDENARQEVRSHIEQLRTILTKLSGKPPQWLDIGKFFVTELNGPALAQLSESALVKTNLSQYDPTVGPLINKCSVQRSVNFYSLSSW